MKVTQHDKILELLSDGGWHSTLEMRNELYVMMPTTRVFELKKDGNRIETEMRAHDGKDGAKIAWYRLQPKDKLFEIPAGGRRYAE